VASLWTHLLRFLANPATQSGNIHQPGDTTTCHQLTNQDNAPRASVGGLHPARKCRPSTGAVKDFKILWPRPHSWPITDEGVAVGGAFDSGTATGLMPIAHRVAGVRSFP
jgi:hypothetical protein